MGPHHVTPSFPKVKWLERHPAALPLGHKQTYGVFQGASDIQNLQHVHTIDERNPATVTSWYVVIGYPIIYKVYICIYKYIYIYIPDGSVISQISSINSRYFIKIIQSVFFV